MPRDFKLNDSEDRILVKTTKKETGLIGLLIKTGLVKTAKQANVILFLFVFLGMSIIIYVNLQTFGN
jgi:hypothetical protein